MAGILLQRVCPAIGCRFLICLIGYHDAGFLHLMLRFRIGKEVRAYPTACTELNGVVFLKKLGHLIGKLRQSAKKPLAGAFFVGKPAMDREKHFVFLGDV